MDNIHCGVCRKPIGQCPNRGACTEEVTISAKDAEAITSYEWVTGYDPETGEAIWETFRLAGG